MAEEQEGSGLTGYGFNVPTDAERQATQMALYQRLPDREIARLLKCSREHACRLRARFRRKIAVIRRIDPLAADAFDEPCKVSLRPDLDDDPDPRRQELERLRHQRPYLSPIIDLVIKKCGRNTHTG